MGEFNLFHWLIVLLILGGFCCGIPWLAYRHGKKVGDQAGYIRGYKEGQQSQQPGSKKVIDSGTLLNREKAMTVKELRERLAAMRDSTEIIVRWEHGNALDLFEINDVTQKQGHTDENQGQGRIQVR